MQARQQRQNASVGMFALRETMPLQRPSEALEPLKYHRLIRPIRRKLRQVFHLGCFDGPLAADGKCHPAAATGTAAGETDNVQIGPHERIMYVSTGRFQAKIDGLQILMAPFVWTASLSLHDVRHHTKLSSSLSIQGMHLLEFKRGL